MSAIAVPSFAVDEKPKHWEPIAFAGRPLWHHASGAGLWMCFGLRRSRDAKYAKCE